MDFKLHFLLKLLLIISLPLLLLSCSQPKIDFINDSAWYIDSMNISVSSQTLYNMKFKDVKPGGKISFILPDNTPVSNGHDVTVAITIFIRNSKDLPLFSYSYDDLKSTLEPYGNITLNGNKKIDWKFTNVPF